MAGDKQHRQSPAHDRYQDPPDQNAAAPAAPAVQAAETTSAVLSRSAEGAAAPRPPEPAPLLAKLLSLADAYRAENSIRQAMSIYFELAEEHAGAPEAYDALERLLEIAKNYEDAGELRQARSLYERLL